MDWMNLAVLIAPAVIGFLLGLIVDNPFYNKVKKVGKLIFDAIQDDKVDNAELKEIIEAVTAGTDVAPE